MTNEEIKRTLTVSSSLWVIVINPTSGQGKGAQVGKSVVGYFAKNDLRYKIIAGISAEAVSRDLKSFLNINPDCKGVISVGGDGLAHLVLQSVVPLEVAFAVIPAGTGNDFARSLNWPLDKLEYQLNRVTTESPSSIDLGMVDGEYFGAILSSGFDAVVNEKANKLKWPSGPAKYNLALALELPFFKPSHFDIELDDQHISTEAMLIAVGNGSSYGGGMRVCPDASVNDGVFDVMILQPVSKLEFVKVFPTVYAGKHVNHPRVSIFRSKKVAISANAIAYADGERIGALPISAECVSNAGLTWKN